MIEEVDKNIAYEYIYCEMMLEVLERDLTAVEQSKLKFKEPYIDKINSIINVVFDKKRTLKHEMRKKGIKSYPRIIIDEHFIDYPFLIRGYEHTQRLWTAAIRKKLKEDYSQYLK